MQKCIEKKIICVLMLMLCVFGVTGCQNSVDTEWQVGTPLDKERIKIGVIHIGDGTDEYSYAHNSGIKKMQETIGLRDDQVVHRLNVNDGDILMTEHAIRECIAEDANVIFTTSWGYMDVSEKLAAEFPNVVFAHASGYKSNASNFTNYFGRIYQARYLSGIAAGLLTKTNKLGYVAAMNKKNSEVTGGINAFARGVETVNPDAQVYVRVTNSWYDPSGERQAALRLIGEGCDVIAQHCDSSAPQTEAEKAGVWGVGYNSDMREDAPGAVLTSVVWRWDVYYTYLVNSVIDGSFTTEPYFGGLAEGMVDITALNEAISTPEIEDAVSDMRKKMLNGEVNVFEGVMETNGGETIGAPGVVLSDDEILGGIDWYYQNVTELN